MSKNVNPHFDNRYRSNRNEYIELRTIKHIVLPYLNLPLDYKETNPSNSWIAN
jgi:hypothetical protein